METLNLLLWILAVEQLHVTDHGVFYTQGSYGTQIYAQGDICGILLCISGRYAIDLGGLYWVMVATKIQFSQPHALCSSPHHISLIALPWIRGIS